jgi:hypothetical protein
LTPSRVGERNLQVISTIVERIFLPGVAEQFCRGESAAGS